MQRRRHKRVPGDIGSGMHGPVESTAPKRKPTSRLNRARIECEILVDHE
jgi:hypothetical protein